MRLYDHLDYLQQLLMFMMQASGPQPMVNHWEKVVQLLKPEKNTLDVNNNPTRKEIQVEKTIKIYVHQIPRMV